MSKFFLLAIVMGIGAQVLAVSPEKKKPVTNELKRFEGEWEIVSVELNGQKLDDHFKGQIVIMKDRSMTLGGWGISFGTFQINIQKA
jgi:hypothetical protein